MNNREIEEMIRTSVPGITKDFVALKAWKEEPKDIPKYDGRAYPGICCQIAEVLLTKETFYFTDGQNFCGSAINSIGLREPRTEEERQQERERANEAHQMTLNKGFSTTELANQYYEVSQPEISPRTKEKNFALQVGLFRDIAEPDIVEIFCTPLAGHVINQAYCFETAKVMKGFGSEGGCGFTIGYPYVQKEPIFTIGSKEWRHYIGLDDSELTLSFPLQSLIALMDCFRDVAERYQKYRKLMEFNRYVTLKTPPPPEVWAKFSKG